MSDHFRALAFTSNVLAAQRDAYGAAQIADADAPPDALGEAEREFVASRDSFYLATVSETGWPYVQHRGGPPGFLRVLDAHTLAFADLRGNRQLLSVGNLASNDRVALFLMDYPGRRRLKILGHATRIDARVDRALAESLAPPGLKSRVERVIAIRVAGFDWNCPQHITPRFTEEEVLAYVEPLKRRIAELEARLAAPSPPSLP
jgi:predicted pyridoxine 5'-phosphate oxidase superfamily flavin-nucleotide-binding protein